MNVLIERFCYTPLGTVGRLTLGDAESQFRCFTIERPWLNNVPCESCIPTGEFSMKLGVYHRGGYSSWEIVDVPGRTLIKIHRANTKADLLGCIGLGRDITIMNDMWAVSESRKAYGEFMEVTGGHTIAAIRIVNTYNEGEVR